MLLALMVFLGGAVAGAQASTAASDPVYGPPAPAAHRHAIKAAGDGCHSDDPRQIIVCGQQRQGYRLDPSVMDAAREVKSANASATSALPAAQVACSTQPMGCGKGFAGLDLANVALVVATTAVTAARGKDWKKALRMGGPDEYQILLEAKHRREAEQASRGKPSQDR